MILPRQWVPKRFQTTRIEALVLESYRPTMMKLKKPIAVATAKKAAKIGQWNKRAKAFAATL